MVPLKVLVPACTPRLQYTLNWVLAERLGIPFELKTEGGEVPEEGPLLCYGISESTRNSLLKEAEAKAVDGGGTAFLDSAGLLFEEGLSREEVYGGHKAAGSYTGEGVTEWEAKERDCPLLFGTGHALGHDPLSAVFWLVSRYEEYRVGTRDRYGRFRAEDSLAFRLGYLDFPMADFYVHRLGLWLQAQFPLIRVAPLSLVVQPTVDVDLCYSYLGKPLLRSLGGCLRDAFNLNWRGLQKRWKVWTYAEHDPFDTYEMLERWHRNLEQKIEVEGFEAGFSYRKPIYFWLMGNYGGPDKGHDPASPFLRQALGYVLQQGRGLGWHPSWKSSREKASCEGETEARLGREELKALQQIKEDLGTPSRITRSRQHYLYLSLPEQPRRLIACGIEEDYSMGYADWPGFRAGTGHSFGWYDLEREQACPLRMYPLTMMDVTFRYRLGLGPEQAWRQALPILDAFKAYGGYMTLVWHNSSFGSDWNGWEHFWHQCYGRFLQGPWKATVPNGAVWKGGTARWRILKPTPALKKNWDTSLGPGTSVYWTEAYLSHRFGRSWRLLVSPCGHWVFPIPGYPRALRGVWLQPLMLQRLALLPWDSSGVRPGGAGTVLAGSVGVQATPKEAGLETYLNLIQELHRRFRRVDAQLDREDQPWEHQLMLPGPAWRLVFRTTYVLDLNQDEEDLWKGYSEHHRRYLRGHSLVLQKAGDGMWLQRWQASELSAHRSGTGEAPDDPQEWINALEKALKDKAGWNRSRTIQAVRLVIALMEQGLASAWALRSGTSLLSGAVLLHSSGTLIYQFAFDTPEGRSVRASLHLVQGLLNWSRHESATERGGPFRWLDFEGSDRAGLQRFYGGFGAVPRTYWRIVKSQYPFDFLP